MYWRFIITNIDKSEKIYKKIGIIRNFGFDKVDNEK